jgi:hypothetical protein
MRAGAKIGHGAPRERGSAAEQRRTIGEKDNGLASRVNGKVNGFGNFKALPEKATEGSHAITKGLMVRRDG